MATESNMTTTYKVKQLTPLTDSVLQVFLTPANNKKINYRAGQYIEIVNEDGETRPFSIANAPNGTADIELHIRHTVESPFLSDVIDQILQQEPIQLIGPGGKNIYRDEPSDKVIFLAGGTGLSPLKAIIEQLLQQQSKQAIHLYWGARNLNELYLDKQIRQWAEQHPHFDYTPVLSEPTPEDKWQGLTGFVHEAVVNTYPEMTDLQVYAAGPDIMVYKAREAFEAQGLNPRMMYSDTFDFENKS